MKNKNGITLIALIVTIIVMLILVGVTINVAVNSGLFDKAKYASKETQKAADREELLAAVLAAYDSETGTVDINRLQEILGSSWTMQGSSFPYTFTKLATNNSFLVYQNGNIEDIEDIEIYTNDFEISLSVASKTEESVSIQVNMDLSSLVEPITFADDAAAMSYFYSMAGEDYSTYSTEKTIEVIEKLTGQKYDFILNYFETAYGVTNPSTDTVIKMLIVGGDYEDYTLKQAMELVANSSNTYEPEEEETILVNGTPVASVNWELDKEQAIFQTTETGNLEVEVRLDNYKAKGSIIVDPVGDFQYTYDENEKEATVVGLTSSGTEKINSSGEITIPQTTMHGGEEYTVTAIGNWTFSSNNNLTSVNMPNSITSIENGAFSSCKNLEISSLPNGLTNIGNNAFSNCTKLDLTSLPSGLTSIGNSAFAYCTSLDLTSLPSGLTSIGEYAFGNCTNLALTSLPSGLTSIEEHAFSTCTKLDLTSLPSGLTSIGNYAFSECTTLALTSLPNGVTSIGTNAFFGCTNLALTSLPSGVTSIEDGTFQNCTNLALTSLPSGVTSIGNYAFKECTGLALTSLPSGVTSIGNMAFEDCLNLALTSLPNGLISIGGQAFSNCRNLALTSLPNGLTSIGNYAFLDCVSLDSMTLPNGLTNVGEAAFCRCKNLTKIEIPSSVTTMGEHVFDDCDRLGDIYIVGRSSKPEGWDSSWQGTAGLQVEGGTTVHWNSSMPQN